MRLIVFGNDDQAARLLVESMHDAWSQRAVCGGESRHVMQQCIHQRASIACAIGCAGASMNHHARGLIDDGNKGIFIDDIKRHGFRFGPQRQVRRLVR